MIKDILLGRFAPIEKRTGAIVIVFAVAMLLVRFGLARPFWNSGVTRWVDFPAGYLTNLATSTTYLFENLFQLHFFWGAMPIPFPGFTAWMTGALEIILPILIVLGLLTRLGALGLLGMSLVIQLVFPDGLINPVHPEDSHLLWMALAAVLVVCGPGMFSLDHLLRRYWPGGQKAMAA